SQAEFAHIHSDKDEPVAEAKPAQSVLGQLFSTSGRIPRGAFWGTMVLIGILTLFIFVMTSLIAVSGGHFYVPGGGWEHVFTSIFVAPNAIVAIKVIRIIWLAVMAWIA